MFKLYGLLLLLHILGGAFAKSTWKYDIISVNSNSTHEDLLNLDLKAERVSRGVYAVSGKVHFFLELNDDVQMEVNAYRSATGTSAYKKIPYNISRRTFEEFMNTMYKDLLMESLKSCSDTPQFTDKLPPPMEKKVYELKRCNVSNENFPHMVDGYYKLVASFYGPNNLLAILEISLKIEAAIM